MRMMRKKLKNLNNEKDKRIGTLGSAKLHLLKSFLEFSYYLYCFTLNFLFFLFLLFQLVFSKLHNYFHFIPFPCDFWLTGCHVRHSAILEVENYSLWSKICFKSEKETNILFIIKLYRIQYRHCMLLAIWKLKHCQNEVVHNYMDFK